MKSKYAENTNTQHKYRIDEHSFQNQSTKAPKLESYQPSMTDSSLLANYQQSVEIPALHSFPDIQKSHTGANLGTPGSNIAYVPVAFPQFPQNYVSSPLYGYPPNGITPMPMYSYNPKVEEKERESWIAGNYSQRTPLSYVSFSPQTWHGSSDVKNQAANMGIVTNGFIVPNGIPAFPNAIPQIPVNSSFDPGKLIYQNGNVNTSLLRPSKSVSKPLQPILGSLIGPEVGQEPQIGIIPQVLSNSIRNGIPTASVSTQAPDFASIQDNLHSVSQVNFLPVSAEPQHSVFRSFHDLNLANTVPLVLPNGVPNLLPNQGLSDIIPAVRPHRLQNEISMSHQNAIENINASMLGKNPVFDPHNLTKPAKGPNFVNMQNDVGFHPISQTPIVWKHLAGPHIDDIPVVPLPREIQPPQFLNVYPITGVPMPTLLTSAPILTKQKRVNSEEANKNRKYACKYCSKKFSRPSSLQTHTYTHTGERPFPCTLPNCGRSFSVLSNLRRHLHVCQKNLRKRLQLNEYLQRSATNESAPTSNSDEKVRDIDGENACQPKDENQDQNLEKPSSNDGASSTNSNGCNSDVRSTDSGSEETKNDSGIGGSVSSMGSRIRAKSAGKDPNGEGKNLEKTDVEKISVKDVNST